jgi:ribosomal protein S18 acetylase RimI-like enzyme
MAARALTLADVVPAARVISEAFAEDPLCAYMLPNRRSRVKTLYRFFLAVGELSIKNNRGYGAGEPLAGVAYWQTPEQDDLSVSISSLGKFLPLLFTQYPLGHLRARPILRQIDALHAQHISGPHYYLDNLGVLPSARGQGLSSQLIRPLLARADAEHVPAYTDTVTPSNVGLYEHFGFQCVARVAVGRTGVTVFAMRRAAV